MVKRVKGWKAMMPWATMLPAALWAQTNNLDQDVGTGTPPELRGFRLDQPQPRPEPEQAPPQPTPTQIEPTPTLPAAGAPAPRATRTLDATEVAPSSLGRSRAEEHQKSADGASAKRETLPALPPAGTEIDAVSEAAVVASNAASTAAQTPASPSATQTLDGDWLIWGGGAAALLAMLIAAFFALRRRRSGKPENEDLVLARQIPALQPSPPTRLDEAKSAEPLEPGSSPPPSGASILSVAFAPTAAQLSIASLTITGKLTVENHGNATATNLALRSQMISAQDGQREAIETFHSNLGDGEIQSLGEMAAGERIDAIIEIRLPRTELQAFRWTGREFVAPIVLINVSGQMGTRAVEAQLSQLIGRQGEESSPRMKPLAIDRGPKRYSGVSARPVFA